MTLQVKETKNYEMFKSIVGNRPTNELHLNRLKKSMEEQLLVSPIIVNEKFQVIDGQHRLSVSKELGLLVRYIVCEGYGLEEVQRLNQNSKDWKMIDFIEGYAQLGNKDYQYLHTFYGNTGLSVSNCVTLLSNSGTATNDIRNGVWTAKHKRRATTIFEWLEIIKQYYKGYKRSSFVAALMHLYKNEEFNFSQLVSKISLQPMALVDCVKTEDYITLLESIYNYKSRNKVNLRF